MGKWAERLEEKTSVPPWDGTDRTDKRQVLSVLAVAPQGGARDFQAAPMPVGGAAAKVEPLDLASVAWTDIDIARFLDRRARLVRWGWAEPDAEALAERLTVRDRDGDDRRLCVECAHFCGGRCQQAEWAGIGGPEVGALALVLQRCPAFEPAGHVR